MLKHGKYCKKCGVDIRLNGDTASKQSMIYNQEKEILYCEECKPRKESKYNQPYRRFWNMNWRNPQWSNLRRNNEEK